MTSLPPLTRAVMLERMLAADATYDGRFITGVVSTGIYCLPSCHARKPKAQNVVFYATPQAARSAGLRPCLRCRPDDYYAGIYPDEGRIAALSALNLSAVQGTGDLAHLAGVGPRTLHTLFREQLQVTPAEWLTRRRITQAQKLLLSTSQGVAEIAFGVGFESLSAFNEQFRRGCALTPQAYRRLQRTGAFELRLPENYAVSGVLRDLNRDPQHMTARVRGQTLLLGLRLPTGPALVQVDVEAGRAKVRPQAEQADGAALHAALLRVLGLTQDPARFEAFLATQPRFTPLLAGRRGLRLPLTPDLFDGLVWAILGQQVTFAFACTLRKRLLERTGTELGAGLYAPPSAADLAQLTEADLRALGLTRARAKTLLNVSRLVATGALDLSALAAGPIPRAERELLALPGLGPWSVNYLLLRAFGVPDALPLGDSALATSLQQFFGCSQRPDKKQVQELMQPFRPHRSLATFYFWQEFSRYKEQNND